MHITLDGYTAKPEDLWAFSAAADNPHAKISIDISPEAWSRIDKAADFVANIVTKNHAVYGINTGFGKFAEVAINSKQLAQLQENLILSHACGVGPELSRRQTLLMWLLRINTLARGNSGVRRSTLEGLLKILSNGILSCVPCQGSVGASGDLAPSAHATLTLLGRGMCTVPNGASFSRISSAEALNKFNLSPIILGPKEGLSLINGTQLTTAYAIEAWALGKAALDHANLAASISIEGLRASHTIADPRIATARNHPGSVACSKKISSWIESSKSQIKNSHENCGRVQDPYSLRCAPQVHGAIFDELNRAHEIIEREINSSTDNPLLFPEDAVSLSGGNFHAIYTARVCDQLASALTTLSVISERRISLYMAPESSLLPAFLIKDGGINSGFMMAQVTAAALASENKSLSFPASVDSIPTSGDREDHVSMGPIAGRKAIQIANNCLKVLGIELLAGAQALDFLLPLKPGPRLQSVHSLIRRKIPHLGQDRILANDFEEIQNLIDQGELIRV